MATGFRPVGPGGMELRDYFAGQAISQCHITVIREEPEPDASVVAVYAERYARTAYAIADAMIAVRDRLMECVCGQMFVKRGRRQFCSDRCQRREYMRRYRAEVEAS